MKIIRALNSHLNLNQSSIIFRKFQQNLLPLHGSFNSEQSLHAYTRTGQQLKHILKCKPRLLKEGKISTTSSYWSKPEGNKKKSIKATKSLKTWSEEILEASIQDLLSVPLYQCPSISPFMFASPLGWLQGTMFTQEPVWPRSLQTPVGPCAQQSPGEI